jgi:alpha-galactosidase
MQTSHPVPPLALTPPMGWNSWDAYGPSVREDEVIANAEITAARLLKYGWDTIVVDIQWYAPKTQPHGYIPDPHNVVLDEFGRLIPDPLRFPSSANGVGFKALADTVHNLGLKFGIHIMRGIPRWAVEQNLPVKGNSLRAADIADPIHVCTWLNQTDMFGIDHSRPGAQAYYDSIAELYASWGVDFVKADDIAQSHDPSYPYHAAEIAALSQALRKSGRPIILSLSPGPAPLEQATHLRQYANLWRISNDFWDDWAALKRQFERAHRWQAEIQPGGWPDADMLPLGRIGIRGEVGHDRWTNFTRAEQRTLMSAWCIFRSPLMFGGDLPSNDEWTFSLMTNPEVLAVNQNSWHNHQSYAQDELLAWTAEIPGSSDRYVAVFNLSDTQRALQLSWDAVDIPAHSGKVRDLWAGLDLGTQPSLQVTLLPHASWLIRVTP